MTTYIVSIDPGGVHCGVAYWARGTNALWECHWAVEMNPDECVDYVRSIVTGMDKPHKVFIEGFWLKPGLDAIRQAGSQMETCEVIGTVRNLCRWYDTPMRKVANGQQATITRLTAAGYAWVAHGNGGHAKDAEAVGVNGLGLKVRQLQQLER